MRASRSSSRVRGLVVDLVAGGGGASTGLEAALGRPVDVAINHSASALAVHTANHPRTTHLTADIWEVKPRDVTRGRPVEVLWASPLPTGTAGGNHLAEVRAFLMTYYGGGSPGQPLQEPMRTVTAVDRLGLVKVGGVEHQIVDIGMRMLEPEELLRAQFGEFASGYDLSAAKSKAAKVRLIGNSVCPEAARALVRANITDGEKRAAA